MNFTPGYFKVCSGQSGGRRETYHFLKVWIQEGEKYIQIDHDQPQKLDGDYEAWFNQDYKLIATYTNRNPIRIVSPKVIFEFKEGAHLHKMEAKNWGIVERILQTFPRIKQALDLK